MERMIDGNSNVINLKLTEEEAIVLRNAVTYALFHNFNVAYDAVRVKLSKAMSSSGIDVIHSKMTKHLNGKIEYDIKYLK